MAGGWRRASLTAAAPEMTAERLLSALLLQQGYNATLVSLGAALLGAAAGAAGSFLFLRRRALVSDAVAHATLPGIALAFIIIVSLGGDGRSLPALLAGAAVSATLGLLAVAWLVARTRLPEDAAIAAVLSSFFGLGTVLMTVVQSLPRGRQAGLEGLLLGSTAGMLFEDAVVITGGAAITALALFLLRRPMTLVAFDPGHAATIGLPVARIDLAIMAIVTAVVVVGLKVVGLVLIVALLVIPPVTARIWTDRVHRLVPVAALFGALAGHGGAAISASSPNLPTGALVVLTSASLFALSLLLAPTRGAVAGLWRHWQLQRRVHRRQGLLALAQGHPILDRLSLRVLRAEGLIRRDGVATEAGRASAARALHDERRWQEARAMLRDHGRRLDGLEPIESLLTPDEIAEIDRRIGPPAAVGG